MSDEFDYEDTPCPKCGAYEVRSEWCDEWSCDDGYIDEHEEDAINFAPGMCPECFGTGVLRWCGKCGCDITHYEYQQALNKEGHTP